MKVEIQCGTESLDEGHGAALCFAHRAELSGAADQRCENGLDKDGEDVAHQRRVVGQAEAQGVVCLPFGYISG